MFIGFVNFYQQFIKSFSQIATPLTSMLKTSIEKLMDLQARLGEVVRHSISSGGARLVVAQNANLAKSKSQNLAKSKKSVKIHDKPSNSGFFIPKAKNTFTKLRQAFIKNLTLIYFKLDCYIQIEMNVSDYAIEGVLS